MAHTEKKRALKNNRVATLTNNTITQLSGWGDQEILTIYFKNCDKLQVDEYHQLMRLHSKEYSSTFQVFEGLGALEMVALIQNNQPQIEVEVFNPSHD